MIVWSVSMIATLKNLLEHIITSHTWLQALSLESKFTRSSKVFHPRQAIDTGPSLYSVSSTTHSSWDPSIVCLAMGLAQLRINGFALTTKWFQVLQWTAPGKNGAWRFFGRVQSWSAVTALFWLLLLVPVEIIAGSTGCATSAAGPVGWQGEGLRLGRLGLQRLTVLVIKKAYLLVNIYLTSEPQVVPTVSLTLTSSDLCCELSILLYWKLNYSMRLTHVRNSQNTGLHRETEQ